MLKELCAGHETEIILLLVILVISIGKGSGMLLLQLLKKVAGLKESVTVNVGTQDRAAMAGDRAAMAGDRAAMAGDRAAVSVDRAVLTGQACLIPENCPKHEAEHDRSKQNEKDIAAVKEEVNKNRELYWKEFKRLHKGVQCILNGLLAKQIIDPRDLPRED